MNFTVVARMLILAIVLAFQGSGIASAAETVKGAGAKDVAKSSAFKLTPEEEANGAIVSPYKACAGVLVVPSSDYAKPFWQARNKSCDAKVSNCLMPVQVIPDIGIFKSFSGVKDGPTANLSSRVTAAEFLDGVRKDTILYLDEAIKKNEVFANKCFSSTAPAECSAEVQEIRNNMAKEGPAFRKALATMSLPSEQDLIRAIASDDPSVLIDSKFENLGVGIRFPKMKPLSSDEVQEAKAEYAAIFKKTRASYQEEVEKLLAPLKVKGREVDLANRRRQLMTDPQLAKNIRAELDKHRAEKLEHYYEALTKHPEIAYIGDPAQSALLMKESYGRMVDDSKASLAAMKKTPSKNLATTNMDSSLLRYAGFSQIIERKLAKEVASGEVSSCAVATAVFQELKSDQAKNALITAGVSIGGLFGGPMLRAAGWAFKGASGAGALSATGLKYTTEIAVTSGLLGGLTSFGLDAQIGYEAHRDSKAGLVKPKDAQEAVASGALGAVFLPLDFMGSGTVVIGGAALAAKGVQLAGKTVGKFAAASIERGKLKGKNVSAAELRKLAQQASNEGGENVATINRLGIAVDGAAKDLLGRAPEAVDEKAISNMAASGLMGTTDAPATEVAKDYAAATLKMASAEREAFAARLEEISRVAKGGEVTGGGRPLDAARSEEAGRLAVAIAAEPGLKATAEILKPSSGWSKDAIKNLREVVVAAIALAKGDWESCEGSSINPIHECACENYGRESKQPTSEKTLRMFGCMSRHCGP